MFANIMPNQRMKIIHHVGVVNNIPQLNWYNILRLKWLVVAIDMILTRGRHFQL